jgi:hypothetical protein
MFGFHSSTTKLVFLMDGTTLACKKVIFLIFHGVFTTRENHAIKAIFSTCNNKIQRP